MIRVFIQNEAGVLAALPGETPVIDEETKAAFTEFIAQAFDHVPGKQIAAGRFLGREAAEAQIRAWADER